MGGRRLGRGRLTILLLALAINTSQAFQLAAPGSEEAQHHHHDHEHEHDHEHAHDGHDHHEEHNTSGNLNSVISDIFEGGGGEVREGKAASETLEEAVARGGVDFSEAEVIIEEDGTVKECVEKEEIREEYRLIYFKILTTNKRLLGNVYSMYSEVCWLKDFTFLHHISDVVS